MQTRDYARAALWNTAIKFSLQSRAMTSPDHLASWLMWSSAYDLIKVDELILFGAAEAFFTPGQAWITPEDRLCVKLRSSHKSNQMHNQRSILTLPSKTNEQDRFCYSFVVADRFDWIKFDVWLKQNYLSRRLMWSTAFDPGLKENKGWFL